jgi:hypothetical protein
VCSEDGFTWLLLVGNNYPDDFDDISSISDSSNFLLSPYVSPLMTTAFSITNSKAATDIGRVTKKTI